MAMARALRTAEVYSENEVVLCFNGPLLYDAKVLPRPRGKRRNEKEQKRKRRRKEEKNATGGCCSVPLMINDQVDTISELLAWHE